MCRCGRAAVLGCYAIARRRWTGIPGLGRWHRRCGRYPYAAQGAAL